MPIAVVLDCLLCEQRQLAHMYNCHQAYNPLENGFGEVACIELNVYKMSSILLLIQQQPA